MKKYKFDCICLSRRYSTCDTCKSESKNKQKHFVGLKLHSTRLKYSRSIIIVVVSITNRYRQQLFIQEFGQRAIYRRSQGYGREKRIPR